MGMLERDYVLRAIQQLAQAIGRILGLKRAGRLEEALAEVGVAADAIFGTLRSALDAIDPQSAARLLASREKIEAYAMLTAEEASIRRLMGEAAQAARGELRALSLYLEAVLMDGDVRDANAAIAELRRTVDETRLPQRYREALASLPPQTLEPGA